MARTPADLVGAQPDPPFEITFDGRRVTALPGQTVAAALWGAGILAWRTTRKAAGRAARSAASASATTASPPSTANPTVAPAWSPPVPATRSPPRKGTAMTASPSEAETGRDPRAPYDLAVVGAGSAGLAGAVTAAELGLSVALLDSSPQSGGQFYRHPAPALGAVRPEALHHAWSAFSGLRRRLAESTVDHLSGHHVWSTVREADGTWSVHAVTGADGTAEAPALIRARTLLLATGAYERQLPFPGWTLPGVVGAGGAQAMLKSGLVLPGRRVVVAGSGPCCSPSPPRSPRPARGCRPWSRQRAICGTPAAPGCSPPTRRRPPRPWCTGPRCSGTVCGCCRAARSPRCTAPTGWRPSPSAASTPTGGPYGDGPPDRLRRTGRRARPRPPDRAGHRPRLRHPSAARRHPRPRSGRPPGDLGARTVGGG